MKEFDVVLIENGKKLNRKIEAENSLGVYEKISGPDIQVLAVNEVKSVGFLNLSFNLPFFSGIKTKEKILIAKNLSSMIDAGLSVSRSISVLIKQSRSVKVKEVLNDIYTKITTGSTLYEAFSAHKKDFSPLFISMVRAGEESGSLSDSLKNIAEQMENSYDLEKRVRGALMYPSIILTLMFAIAFAMLVFVIPQITATFKDLKVELPLSTRMIIFISDTAKDHWLLSLSIILVLIFSIYSYFKTTGGKRVKDFIFLHIPIISALIKETNSARTARTLSSLLKAGVGIIPATDITRDVVQNSYFKDVLVKVRETIERGEQISGVFEENENLYPVLVGEMIAVGEETGKLGEMLENIAKYYEKEVSQKTKDMSSIIEPFLMIVIGIAVGFFAYSMIGPIYSIGDAIK